MIQSRLEEKQMGTNTNTDYNTDNNNNKNNNNNDNDDVQTCRSASGLQVINHEDETVCIDTNGLVLSGDVAIRIYKFRAHMSFQELRPTLGVHASTCQYGLNKGAQICFIQYHTYFSQEVYCAPVKHIATVFTASLSQRNH